MKNMKFVVRVQKAESFLREKLGFLYGRISKNIVIVLFTVVNVKNPWVFTIIRYK